MTAMKIDEKLAREYPRTESEAPEAEAESEGPEAEAELLDSTI